MAWYGTGSMAWEAAERVCFPGFLIPRGRGVLVQYIFSIGAPFLLVVPMTCFVRSDRRPAHTLPAEVWMSALFMCLGLGYIFNFLGVFLDVFFSIFTGVPATDMNPVMDASMS